MIIFGDPSNPELYYDILKISVKEIANLKSNYVAGIEDKIFKNYETKNKTDLYFNDNEYKGSICDCTDPYFFRADNCEVNFKIKLGQDINHPIIITDNKSSFFEITSNKIDIHSDVSLIFNIKRDKKNEEVSDLVKTDFDENREEIFCLVIQDNQECDKILDKWNIHYFQKTVNDYVCFNFKLKDVATAVFGSINYSNTQFYNGMRPGLNYIICCGKCDKILTCEQGFNKFRPIEDLRKLRCPKCNNSIKVSAIVLLEAHGFIEFESNLMTENQPKEFNIKGINNWIALGLSNKSELRFLVITVSQHQKE